MRENNKILDKTYLYEYNSIGNITKVKEYAYSTSATPSGTASTKTFTYGNTTFPDRLTAYNGSSVTYNTMGCATKYNGYTATWTRGKLAKLYKGNNVTGTHSYNHIYNASGQRKVFEYIYTKPSSSSEAVAMGTLMSYHKNFHYDQFGRLVYESKTNRYYGEDDLTEKIVYLYDESGMIGMVFTTELGATSTYYYHRNLLGDVVGIYNTSGTKVGGYSYDAWGNCTITLDTNGIATRNPIRYRGYYYDEDTQLYYLNSRYYSPLWRRFISPDDTAFLDPDTVNGLNLYSYANNNPVNVAYHSTSVGGSDNGGMVSSLSLGGSISTGTMGGVSSFSFAALPAVPNALKHISKVNDVFSAVAHSAIVSNYLFHNVAFMDDMIMDGNNPARALGYLPKASWINKMGYVFSAMDAVVAFYDNMQQGNSFGQAVLDSSLSFGSSWVSGLVGGYVGANVGGYIGTLVGSFVPIPIASSVIGFIAGTAIGICVSWAVDNVLGNIKDELLYWIFD